MEKRRTDSAENPKKRRKKRSSHRMVWTLAGLVGLCIVLILVILLTPPDEYGPFLDALGMRESTNNYTLVNQYGYMGRYQMGGVALADAGFQNESGEWTELANAYGIYSREDFLNSPEGQDAAIRAYHTRICSYIHAYDLDQYVGKRYCGVKVTRSGLLASCHLVGIGTMKNALVTDSRTVDGNGVPASEYMELFAGYDISTVWNGE